ncbi:divergent polysaccharide deacetylase family protein [Reyranella sp.]|uniref:divergent polysaccharide deacetylase family protein n=1 Tax=Reyranella sp. TaxID=1929291 RepID=UPI003D0CC733
MASRKNRSGKANRRRAKRPPSALTLRWRAFAGWIHTHRWHAATIGLLLLFAGGLVGGYWIAGRVDGSDRDKIARDALEDMKRGAQAPPPPLRETYARIEDIPGLPRYTETEPGQQRATVEEKPRTRQVAMAAAATEQSWRRNALPFRDLDGKPLIAIVIDDVGLDRPHSKRAWELPGPLTMSFLPYAKDLREQAKAARAHGQELMLHLPMEPTGRADPGPNALLVSLPDAELKQRVTMALDSFDGYVGVNNHMGSRFTAFKPGMETVLRQFKARGLLFLDSRTTPQSVGDQLARELGVPSVARNVFLDDDESLGAVRRRLAETEEVARRQGFAVAIGHPHEATIQALADWLPTVSGKGFALAPLSAVLRKRNGWD